MYLDDVVVYSDSWAEHLVRIRMFLGHLVDANLPVNLAKCEFGRGTVTYLGKIVGQGQVCPVREKVVAIDWYPTPTMKKELMRFLGMAGYYCTFCRNFSVVVTPFIDLLKGHARFVWSHVCQEAFDAIKHS